MPRERYVFAVEMAQLLRRAGPILVQYLLRAYDGRLSLLVADLRRFVDRSSTRTRAGCRDARGVHPRDVRARAPHDVAVSLCALRHVAGRRCDVQARAATRRAFDPDVDYELSPDVEILPDLHDCQLADRADQGGWTRARACSTMRRRGIVRCA